MKKWEWEMSRRNERVNLLQISWSPLCAASIGVCTSYCAIPSPRVSIHHYSCNSKQSLIGQRDHMTSVKCLLLLGHLTRISLKCASRCSCSCADQWVLTIVSRACFVWTTKPAALGITGAMCSGIQRGGQDIWSQFTFPFSEKRWTYSLT